MLLHLKASKELVKYLEGLNICQYIEIFKSKPLSSQKLPHVFVIEV